MYPIKELIETRTPGYQCFPSSVISSSANMWLWRSFQWGPNPRRISEDVQFSTHVYEVTVHLRFLGSSCDSCPPLLMGTFSFSFMLYHFNNWEPCKLAHTYNPSIWRQRQEDYFKFKSILVNKIPGKPVLQTETLPQPPPRGINTK